MADDLRHDAAMAALEQIRSGMIVGLGSGSTASHFIRELGGRVRAGLRVTAIATSEESSRLAAQAGIPLTDFNTYPLIDITVDGADEVSPALDLIKGLGGALVREKIVAHASKRFVVIAEDSKLVERLGTRTVVPVEVIPMAATLVVRQVERWGGEARIREKDGRPFVSDNGNHIVDWKYGIIDQPALLEKQLKGVTGVVDSGIFSNVADCVIVAGASGVRTLERP